MASAVHTFWRHQPVQRAPDPHTSGPVSDLVVEPVGGDAVLAAPLHRDTLQPESLHAFLQTHYVVDARTGFRLAYTRAQLDWLQARPGSRPRWCVGLLDGTQLCGSILATPCTIRLHEDTLNVVEVNLLCLAPQIRSKHLAPLLIQELRRRVLQDGFQQAVFFGRRALPGSLCSTQLFHRALDIRALVRAGFTPPPTHATLDAVAQAQMLAAPRLPGLRPLLPGDVPEAAEFLRHMLRGFSCAPDFHTVQDAAHQLLPRPGVVDTWIERNDVGQVVSLCSHTFLRYIKGEQVVMAARSRACVSVVHDPVTMMRQAMVLARQSGAQVFDAYENVLTAPVFQRLGFHRGDARVHTHLYNWQCRPVRPGMSALTPL
jgi:glycylpeptide N-tetradecanoyltransferase